MSQDQIIENALMEYQKAIDDALAANSAYYATLSIFQRTANADAFRLALEKNSDLLAARENYENAIAGQKDFS